MKLDNIRGIVTSQAESRLQPAPVDLVFVSATYHHFEYPQTMLASMYRVLRSGGQLMIIDFRKQAGYKFHLEASVLKTNYFLRFE